MYAGPGYRLRRAGGDGWLVRLLNFVVERRNCVPGQAILLLIVLLLALSTVQAQEVVGSVQATIDDAAEPNPTRAGRCPLSARS